MAEERNEGESPRLFNGRRVRAWCVDAGVSYDQLAASIGKKPGTVRSWVYGQRRIDFDDACLIVDFFGKTLDELRLDQKAA